MLGVALNRLFFFRNKLCAKSVPLSPPASVTQKPLTATGAGIEPGTRSECWAFCPRPLESRALGVTAAKGKRHPVVIQSTTQPVPRSLPCAGPPIWSVMGQDTPQKPQDPAQVQLQILGFCQHPRLF